jgi:hypothetical protein
MTVLEVWVFTSVRDGQFRTRLSAHYDSDHETRTAGHGRSQTQPEPQHPAETAPPLAKPRL